jgi:hypothetical protein
MSDESGDNEEIFAPDSEEDEEELNNFFER